MLDAEAVGGLPGPDPTLGAVDVHLPIILMLSTLTMYRARPKLGRLGHTRTGRISMTTTSDRVTAGVEGGRRRRHRARRRPGPRGLLPLPAVRGARPRRRAHPRGRLAPAVRGRAPVPRGAPRVRGADRGVAAAPRRAPRGAPPTRRRRSRPRSAGLRTALSQLAAIEDMAPTYDADPATIRANAMRLCAATPVVIAALHRLATGSSAVAPARRPLVRGELPLHDRRRGTRRTARPCDRAVPDPRPSTTASTRRRSPRGSSRRPVPTWARRSWPRSGALSGPLHGGAPSRALDTLDAIGTPENTEAWVRDRGGERGADHGLRAPRVPHRRPALGDAAGHRTGARRPARRLRDAGGVDGRAGARRAQARPRAPHQRRVLRRRGDGAAADCRGSCSPRRSPRVASSGGARTSSSSRPTPRSSARAPATSAPRPRSRYPSPAEARGPGQARASSRT